MISLKEYSLAAEGTKLVLHENVLAVLSDSELVTISSAFHNGGGIKKTRAIMNVEQPKDVNDINLHADPDAVIVNSSKKIGLKGDFVGMITAACVNNFALASKRIGNLGVSVVATAADDEGNTCNYAESAGEDITTKAVGGTINIIVLVDGNPVDSCLVSSVITATEAKTAAMLELDIRSRYSGQVATGTITDAIVVAKTGRGEPIVYAGPASELGQLVGYCTRKAVKEAIMKGLECSPCRSLLSRLEARHLSVEKLAAELSHVEALGADEKTLAAVLKKKLGEPAFAAAVLASVKLDEDFQLGLAPPELGPATAAGIGFGELLSGQPVADADVRACSLPSFLRQVLVALMQKALSEA